ncbi:hypothetical protein, partial [Yersinia similis]|uniref:hypothetical protein n=1 Tax=Yersinia similis TaxID=367190 RepID=UPI000A980F01
LVSVAHYISNKVSGMIRPLQRALMETGVALYMNALLLSTYSHRFTTQERVTRVLLKLFKEGLQKQKRPP